MGETTVEVMEHMITEQIIEIIETLVTLVTIEDMITEQIIEIIENRKRMDSNIVMVTAIEREDKGRRRR